MATQVRVSMQRWIALSAINQRGHGYDTPDLRDISILCPTVRNRQKCARTNDKGERIEREVVLPRQERPKGNECGNKEASRDKDKTPARRHRGLGRRGNNPTRPESDE